jgi:hypothetical protein
MIGVATALMCALAGGAIWCLLSIYSGNTLAAFAFVVALVVVWTLRMHGYALRWRGALLAAFCVALASWYAFYLQAVVRIAALLGIPIRAALVKMDPSMALDIAWASMRGWNLAIIACAAACALFGIMWRKPAARR